MANQGAQSPPGDVNRSEMPCPSLNRSEVRRYHRARTSSVDELLRPRSSSWAKTRRASSVQEDDEEVVIEMTPASPVAVKASEE
jgi:hypothetical protein